MGRLGETKREDIGEPGGARRKLAGAAARENSLGRLHKNLYVNTYGPILRVLEIQADHLVEGRSAATVNLPQAGDPRLHFEEATAVPGRVSLEFIRNRRTRSDERHIPKKHVEEL